MLLAVHTRMRLACVMSWEQLVRGRTTIIFLIQVIFEETEKAMWKEG